MQKFRFVFFFLAMTICFNLEACMAKHDIQDSLSVSEKLFNEYKKLDYCGRIEYFDNKFHKEWNDKSFLYPDFITKIYMDLEKITGHVANCDHGHFGILHHDINKFEEDIAIWRKIIGCCKKE